MYLKLSASSCPSSSSCLHYHRCHYHHRPHHTNCHHGHYHKWAHCHHHRKHHHEIHDRLTAFKEVSIHHTIQPHCPPAHVVHGFLESKPPATLHTPDDVTDTLQLSTDCATSLATDHVTARAATHVIARRQIVFSVSVKGLSTVVLLWFSAHG